MRRPLLTITGIALGVIVLLLVAVAIVVATIDANALVPPVAEQVRRATGRELSVNGGAALTVSLEPRLRLRDVVLANAPGTTTPEMVRARELDVQVALLPLLHRRLDVVRLRLIEPRIALETDAAGRGNWQFRPAEPATSSTQPPETPSGLAFAVGELSIERGEILHHDARSGASTTVEVDRLLVRARDPAQPLHAEFSGRIQNVAVAIEGTAAPLDALMQRRFPVMVAARGEVGGRPLDARAQLFAPQGAPIELREISLDVGESRVTGSLAVDDSGGRNAYRFALASPRLRLQDLAIPVAASSPRTAAAAGRPAPDGRIFPDTPVPLDAVRSADAQGTLALDRLVLSDGREIADLRTTIALRDSRLVLSPFSVSALGGRVNGTIRIDAPPGTKSAVAVDLDAKGVDLAAILAAAGVRHAVSGGKTAINASLRMQGSSPRAWASSASGRVLANVGPAQLPPLKGGVAPELITMLDALNPYRSAESLTELQCAVVRLPFASGVAKVDRSIAVQTAKVGVLASGTIDLRDETLDLSFRPSTRQPVGVDVGQLAGLVRLQGPLRAPAVRVDPRGTAEVVARIGAAAGTGGWSELLRALVQNADSNFGHECDIALGKTVPAARPPAARSSPAAPSAGNPITDIQQLLQGLRRK